MQHVGTEEEEEEEEEECRCSWRKSFPLGASPMHIEQDDHFLSDDAGEKLRAAQAIQGTTEVVLLRLSLRGRDTVMTNSCVMQREATHVQSMCYNSSQQSTYGIVYRLTSSVACATICAHHEQELRPL